MDVALYWLYRVGCRFLARIGYLASGACTTGPPLDPGCRHLLARHPGRSHLSHQPRQHRRLRSAEPVNVAL